MNRSLSSTAAAQQRPLRQMLIWSLLVAVGAVVATSLTVKAIAQTVPAVAIAAPAAPVVPGPTTNPKPVPASVMAHSCAACHGTNGQLGDEFFKPLAGMPVQQFVRTMTDFREGKRASTLMGHVARGFTDADLKPMAEFFAAQQPLATTVIAKGAL